MIVCNRLYILNQLIMKSCYNPGIISTQCIQLCVNNCIIIFTTNRFSVFTKMWINHKSYRVTYWLLLYTKFPFCCWRITRISKCISFAIFVYVPSSKKRNGDEKVTIVFTKPFSVMNNELAIIIIINIRILCIKSLYTFLLKVMQVTVFIFAMVPIVLIIKACLLMLKICFFVVLEILEIFFRGLYIALLIAGLMCMVA